MLYEYPGNCWVGQRTVKAGISYLRQTVMPPIHSTPEESKRKITLKYKMRKDYMRTQAKKTNTAK